MKLNFHKVLFVYQGASFNPELICSPGQGFEILSLLPQVFKNWIT